MSLFNDLHEAKYKGVPFLLSGSNISGGRKDVKHSFPNSNEQTIEDLGSAPRVFSVTAIITSDQDDLNYLTNRNRFLEVLEQGGPGILIHPFYGQLDNMVARSFTLIENMNDLNAARFSVVFEVSNVLGTPTRARNTVSEIEQANIEYVDTVFQVIDKDWKVTFAENYAAAIDKLDAVFDAVEENTKFIQATADKINAFNSDINNFSNNIVGLVNSPNALADSITSTFETMNALYATSTATISVLTGFFGFGSTDVEIPLDTSIRIEKDNNRRLMNGVMNSLALSYSYVNAANIDFQTIIELNEISDSLESQYQSIIANEDLPDSVNSQLTDMRSLVKEFFDEQQLQVRQLLTVNTNLTSARLLAYQYYADSEQVEQLIDLNNFKDVSFIEGDVQVFSE